jgi:hypothetical protein
MTEIRYRRLLALYPSSFRREYEEEMLGVLMADPRPGPGQVFDLVRGAVAARLRQPFAAGDDWRRATRVMQLFGSILLLAVSLRLVAQQAIRAIRHPDWAPFALDTVTAVRLTGWTVVVLAAFLGFRLLGLAGAITGLSGEIANPAQYYADTPATVLHAFWLIMTAAVVLLAGLVADRGPRPRGWPLAALAGVGIVCCWSALSLNPWAIPAYYWSVWQALPPLLIVVAGLGVLRQEPAVRRRVLALAVPVLVTVPLVRVGFDGFIMHNQGHPEALRMLGPGHYAVLVLIPMVAFLAAAELNRRLEASRAVSSAGAGDK